VLSANNLGRFREPGFAALLAHHPPGVRADSEVCSFASTKFLNTNLCPIVSSSAPILALAQWPQDRTQEQIAPRERSGGKPTFPT
jgi:hypothetical protein